MGTGTIDLPEVSGGVVVPGDRLVLVSDEHGLAVVESLGRALDSGALRAHPIEVAGADDLEDVTWTGEQVIAVGSHGRNRRGVLNGDRCVTVHLDADLESARVSRLLQRTLPAVPALSSAQSRTPAQSGLNIEGLARLGDALWVGIRSPTVTHEQKRRTRRQEDAALLCLDLRTASDPEAGVATVVPASRTQALWTLPLGGHGIRGLATADDSLLILSGLSPDPNHEVRASWAVWRWTPGAAPVVVAEIPEAAHPEGLALLEDGRLLLLEDAGEDVDSRYTLIDL